MTGRFHFQPYDDRYEPLTAIVNNYGRAVFWTLRGGRPGNQRWHMVELIEIPLVIAREFGEFIPLVLTRRVDVGLGRLANGNRLPGVAINGHGTILNPERDDNELVASRVPDKRGQPLLCDGSEPGRRKQSVQHSDKHAIGVAGRARVQSPAT